jgi:hypothetical protein
MISTTHKTTMDRLKTWDEIKSYDEIIEATPRLILLIYQIETSSERKCSCLRKEGNYFYYCGVDVPENVEKKPSPFSPIFLKHTDHFSLQLYCMDDYEKCIYYPSFSKKSVPKDKTKLGHFFE